MSARLSRRIRWAAGLALAGGALAVAACGGRVVPGSGEDAGTSATAAVLGVAADGAGAPPASTRVMGATGVTGGTGATATPSVNPVLSVEAWTFGGRPGRAISTPSFRVYTTLADGALVSRVPRFLELALLHYTSELGELSRPQKELETYVMASRPQWAELTQRITGDLSETYLRIQRGGYAFEGRGVFFDIGPQDTLAIAAHEGWHQYTQATFQSGLPVWLEEGIACYMEGFRWDATDPHRPLFLPWANAERFDMLRGTASRGHLVGLPELLGSRPQDLLKQAGDGTLRFYAQAWALVHFLNEGEGGKHRESLRRLLRDAQAGQLGQTLRAGLGAEEGRRAMFSRRGDGVLRVYFNSSAAEMDGAYQAFIKTVVRPGGRDDVVLGRSPVGG